MRFVCKARDLSKTIESKWGDISNITEEQDGPERDDRSVCETCGEDIVFYHLYCTNEVYASDISTITEKGEG